MNLRSHDWKSRYATGRDDLIGEFYGPALTRSVRYDRATGYFRSSLYAITGRDVARFALAGGRTRLLCSPELTREDVAAIQRGMETGAAVVEAADRELRRILAHPNAVRTTEILAALLAYRRLEIRFVLRRRGTLFHDKVGTFSDREDCAVSFAGSVNETWNAWHPLGNHESFEVFTSWGDEGHRVRDHQRFFDDLWDGKDDDVLVYSAPEAFVAGIERYGRDDPEGRLKAVAESPPGVSRRRLFPHQEEAVDSWEAHGRRGILKHATGSGKTVTALAILRDWMARGGPALVIVPSVLLLEQWEREARGDLADLDPAVLLVGGGHDEWRRRGLLPLFTRPTGGSRLTIATVQTAATEDFAGGLQQGAHLLLVADEVHRLGSSILRRVLGVEAGGRLGLSATPERAGDPDGTRVVFEYFGGIIPPVFSLADAIETKRLTPYEYHVDLVHLDDDERDVWLALSRKIGAVVAALHQDGNEKGPMPEELKFLLIKRARIAKQAGEKVLKAADLVAATAQPGQHWLVYCDDRRQLGGVRDALAQRGVRTFEYHSAMQGDKEATLERYGREGGILVAIRCLDEGVDIPAISHAVILASSRNPREFVQRRGRVLRRAQGKTHANIWDLLVEPPRAEREAFDSLALAELARAHEFAGSAENRAVRSQLDHLCLEWGIEPEKIKNLGVEDDVEEISTEEAA